MGSWYPTCCLSNLPITYAEKLVIVPLVSSAKDQTSKGFCYPSDLWRPIVWPLRGKLDTCELDIVKTPKTPHPKVWSALLNRITGLKLTPASFMKEMKRTEPLPIRDPILQGELTATYFHADAWELALKLKSDEPYPAIDFEPYRDFPEAWVEDFRINTPKDPDLASTFEREERFEFRRGVFGQLHHEMKRTDLFLVRAIYSQELDLDSVKPILKEVAEVLFMQRLLQALRRFWSPQSGAGSQDQSYELHTEFAHQIGALAKRLGERE